ncbi:hypothetical protein TMatcc_006114 [Talaromyces marneffei ATCC 18224]|uniref:Uncharacterized protein n=1 Tax=Talaromyces marneffei (strain ATCC 18224 / CBS 334.59 / QM 7333) TaxID=441960 RepID=B6QCK6_TALMQ|nr:uncharacterized protein EYB26_002917 [Talaromyces marneffei]EEA25660.1 hypothetical protein PMAA_067590 [Talaromyces marneffei ATCC 18224]KAE8554365.1 hypothetical protein EYB25_002904 [Talaromyces marneffei]QGA15260.1 hypothetical protein EYB26_002917 [Talaromyces marneffei]
MSPETDGNEHLPFGVTENTTFYHWKDNDYFLSIRDAETLKYMTDQSGCASQYFVFLNVSNEIFNLYFTDTNDYQFNADSYYLNEEAIVIKMISPMHETAHSTFFSILVTKLSDMKLDRKLQSLAASVTKANNRHKEPDQSYRPFRLPKGRSHKWPSLTVEVGFSESRTKLANDARWWLTESAGDVKDVITIYIRKVTKEITIENWNLVPGPNGPMFPRVTYRTVLSQKRDSDDVKISNEVPMTIPFENLFLRPAEGPIERDVKFEKDDLKHIADCVWYEQDYPA